MMPWKRALLTALTASTLCAATNVFAGAFTVTPVRIYMTPRDRAIALTITNEGDSELAIQADINTWTQDAQGRDKLELTEDLILAPPIIKLAPKSRQVVRLALAKPADASRQLTYRMIVREVPEALAPRDNTIQLPIALALSIPVFVTPPVAKPQLDCRLERREAILETICRNTGTAYTQVLEAALQRGGSQLARVEPGLYILPDATKNMQMRPTAAVAPGPVQLRLVLDDGRTQLIDLAVP